MVTAIDHTEDAIQEAYRLATRVWDALCEPETIDLIGLAKAANRYLDAVKGTTPPILAKARTLAMAIIDANLVPAKGIEALKRASRDLEIERIHRLR